MTPTGTLLVMDDFGTQNALLGAGEAVSDHQLLLHQPPAHGADYQLPFGEIEVGSSRLEV
jgi:hypothetical protein